MGFSRQEYRSVLPFPSPGDLPDPGIEPGSPTLQADALPSEPPGKILLNQKENNEPKKKWALKKIGIGFRISSPSTFLQLMFF